ncbi:outer membrane biogenesis protein BamB [Planctomycetes bacterium Pan216]|uniref:Outer membrane biogenesis protein BamB n=1 Tax=Kolteria novifilia TaxID=2527975 RepID=A0A518B1H2_9BACT|nr:outer membrane biogenesis protein BamB [Planctomycetes bacterium Pan216]
MRPTFAALALLGTLSLSWESQAADWNQWRGPLRDGVAPTSPPLIESLPKEGLLPTWKYDDVPSGFEGGWSSPVIADGKVYLYSHQRIKLEETEPPKRKFPWLPPDKRGHLTAEEYKEYEVNRRKEDFEMGTRFYRFEEFLHCLDAATGKVVWKDTRPSSYTRFVHSGTPAAVDGKVYIASAARKARCFDAKSGDLVWETTIPGDFHDEFFMSSFAVVDGVAVAQVGTLCGLDAESGKVLWQLEGDSARMYHSSPVFWDGPKGKRIIANIGGDKTVCVEPKTGRECWRVESMANQSSPVISGDMMITYGGSRKKGLRCFKLQEDKAEPAWVYQGLSDSGSSPVIVGKNVFVQGERRLAAVDLETGKAHWRTTLDYAKPRYTSLLAGDNKVIYAMEGILIFEASDERFEPLIEARVGPEGRLASEDVIRKLVGLGSEGVDPEKAQSIFQNKVVKAGPLLCSTPALADGKLYVRLRDSVVCYDLTNAKGTVSAKTAPKGAAAN